MSLNTTNVLVDIYRGFNAADPYNPPQRPAAAHNVAGLREAVDAGKPTLPAALVEPTARTRWYASLCAREWVVYAKRPFGGPERVLKYLARYTHRVAISNSRLVAMRDGRVTFRYKDYADDHRQKTMTLTADEFLRRFVQHVLPRSFVKVRHYGLLANGQREARLTECRRLLLVANVAQLVPGPDTEPIAPAEPHGCPQCGGNRLVYRELAPGESPQAAEADSS